MPLYSKDADMRIKAFSKAILEAINGKGVLFILPTDIAVSRMYSLVIKTTSLIEPDASLDPAEKSIFYPKTEGFIKIDTPGSTVVADKVYDLSKGENVV